MRILFVCRGNICRSPTAHGIFLNLLKQQSLQMEVDSAGTHAWSNSPPNLESQRIAMQHKVDISELRARPVMQEDFSYYDYLIAMDRRNVANMSLIMGAAENQRKINLLLDYDKSTSIIDVPDPYGAGSDGFEKVYNLINNGCMQLLQALCREIASTV